MRNQDSTKDIMKSTSENSEPTVNLGPVPRVSLTIGEAAKSIGVSFDAIENLVKRDDIPSICVGGKQLIPVESLTKWAQSEVVRQKEDARAVEAGNAR